MTEDELRVKITAEVDDYLRGMERSREETKRFGDGAEDASSRAEEAFGKLKSGLVALGIGKLLKDSVSFAGDLEQNIGGAESVFKSYAGTIRETAKEAATSLGLAESDYLASATKMGALFQGTGISTARSVDMTTAAMQRAADVASIMGIGVDEAMQAITGMAKGNMTMMDNLGVAMTDATLQSYALEKGLGKIETTQDRVTVAMQMFMEKTEYAAGNYAKENDTFAGSLNTLKAEFKNFMTEAGTTLIPTVTNGVKLLGGVLRDISPIVVTLGNGIGLVGDALALVPEPMMTMTVGVIGAITAYKKLNSVLGTTGSKLALIAGLAMIVFGKLKEAATANEAVVSDASESTSENIESAAKAQDDLTDSVNETEKALKSLAGFDEITKLSGSGSAGLSTVSETDVEAVEDYSAALEGAEAQFGELDNAAAIVLGNIADYWGEVWGLITSGDWEGVFKKLGEGADSFLTDLFGDGWITVRDYWGEIIGLVRSGDVEGAIYKVAEDIDASLSAAFGKSWDDFSAFWQGIGAKIQSGDILGALEDFGKAFIEKFEEIFGDAGREWNKFWSNVGAGFYELTNGGKINANELDSKYRVADLNELVIDTLRDGKSVSEARDYALSNYLTTSEAMYWYANVMGDRYKLSDEKILGWQSNLIDSGQLTDPLTEEGVYNAVAAANAGGSSVTEIHTTVELDGDKVGESVTSYQNRLIYQQNGR
ncbi:MAG: hypothetical protein NC084_12855 [Bacteroides sp.]|nr:hypothetical protein [Eubacterium sp.]MCM1419621.1 hypothetical protein [Roseburia sp.]MCM1463584.1 hypothetical protein [Bacteroides sp.]